MTTNCRTGRRKALHGNFYAGWSASCVVAFLVVGFLVAPCTLAVELRVDLDDGDTDPAGNWNTIANRNTTDLNLIDFNTGLGSGIDLTTANWEGETAFAFGWVNSVGFVDDLNAVGDVFFTNSFTVPGNLTFSNLPNGTYTVEVVSSNTGPVPVTEDIRVNGAITTLNFDGLGGVSSDNWDEVTQGFENYLIFENVTPTGSSNTISIDFQALVVDGSALVQAVRIIPEPSSVTLASFGLMALLAYGLRRRRA